MYVIKHTIFFSKKKVKLTCISQNDFPTPQHVNISFIGCHEVQ